MKTENWEKEFDEKLLKSIEEMLDYGNETKDFHLKIKSFIHSLLKSQKAELIDEIEKMKKIPFINALLRETRTIYISYNQALEDVLTKLKNQ